MNHVAFNKQASLEFITRIFGEGKTSNDGDNISVVCPLCKDKKSDFYSKRKLAIRTSDHLTHCWVCGYKSKNILGLLNRTKASQTVVAEYLAKFATHDQLMSAETAVELPHEQSKTFEFPRGFELLATADFENDSYARKILAYLEKRGCSTLHELWYWKFGFVRFDEENEQTKAYYNRVIMPSFDANGNPNYYSGRSIGKSSMKYLNPGCQRESVVFNEINIDWTQELTLVEGPFDLVKCGENATCVLGSTLSNEYLLFQNIVKHQTPVVLAFDADALEKTLKVAENLHEYGVDIRILTLPDSTKDIGDLSKEEVETLCQNATVYTRELAYKLKLAELTASTKRVKL